MILNITVFLFLLMLLLCSFLAFIVLNSIVSKLLQSKYQSPLYFMLHKYFCSHSNYFLTNVFTHCSLFRPLLHRWTAHCVQQLLLH